jgi:thiosulfate/3-mercaptopyruvate sulfurtransferase
MMHNLHGDKLSCQVCHSVSYTSCDGCHVAVSETTDKPFFETEGSYLTFLVGRNELKDDQRPYDYVPVRHVPIASTSFQFYGEDLLPNFDALSTWKYATPHNIQRNTPQTEACTNCHGNPELFLTIDKVTENERAANSEVIVETVPEMPGQ